MAQPEKRTKKTRSRLGRGLSSLVEPNRAAPVEVKTGSLHEQIANNIHTHDSFQHLSDPTHGGAASASETDHETDHETEPGTDHENEIGSRSDRVYEIDLAMVVPNPHQPRRVFSPESLDELAHSISEHGLMQPIIVRRGSGGGFELIAGERRWRACGIAGLKTIRAIMADAEDVDSAMLALIENIQREDLNAIERASGFASLAERFSMTQEQIATRMGISRSSVTNLLRLLELDEQTRAHIASGALSAGHGKVLLGCKDAQLRRDLSERAVADGWSVRRLEREVIGHNPSDPLSKAEREALARRADGGNRDSRIGSILHDLENQLGEHLSTRVHLKTDRSGTKGRILIEFYNLDHFDGLMIKLGMRGNDDLENRK